MRTATKVLRIKSERKSIISYLCSRERKNISSISGISHQLKNFITRLAFDLDPGLLYNKSYSERHFSVVIDVTVVLTDWAL